MTFTAETLRHFCCPETGSELKPLDAQAVQQINESIQQKSLVNRMGKSIQDPIDGALINHEGTWIYTIREGIVSLIVDQAISAKSMEPNHE